MLNVIEFVVSGMMSQQQAYSDETRTTNLTIERNIDPKSEIIDPAAAITEVQLEGKPIRFFKEIEPALPAIKGDKRLIRQILISILLNAAKFTEEGSITLRVTRLHKEILFAVIDTGTGIKAEDQTRIFSPLRKTQNGVKHGNNTGIGLATAKRLIEAHQGQFWVKSEYGHGTAFYFTLPLTA